MLKENFPFEYELIDGEKLSLSSSGLRKKLKENELNENDLPEKVLNYINENNLY